MKDMKKVLAVLMLLVLLVGCGPTPAEKPVVKDTATQDWLLDHYTLYELKEGEVDTELAMERFAAFLDENPDGFEKVADGYYENCVLMRGGSGSQALRLELIHKDPSGLRFVNTLRWTGEEVEAGPSGREDTPEATLVADLGDIALIARGTLVNCPAADWCEGEYETGLYAYNIETGEDTEVIPPQLISTFTVTGQSGQTVELEVLHGQPHSDQGIIQQGEFDLDALEYTIKSEQELTN